jgi:conjugative relaxase-like TrwC/TraI family protein
MLSISKVAAGQAAASYYEAGDDYYHQDRSPSQWQGEGAARLGLNGVVDARVFRDLLDGKMPDGSQIHNAAEGRRGGTDFTFSAPKSLSLQAFVSGDGRLIDAHERAVAKTLAHVESTLASYRVTDAGITRTEASNNLLVASFRHDLSRATEPQLHTHAVVINATQRGDDQWRALDQGNFYREQKLLGALYRNELALEVRALGYEVRLTHGDGRFELAHINERQVEAFSSRSQAIEIALAAQGKTREEASAREKEVAALATRDSKVDVDRAALRSAWQEKSQALGIDYQPAPSAQHLEQISTSEARALAARDAVAFAVEHHSERQSVMSESQLVRSALERGTGRTDLEAIKDEILRQSKTGELINAGVRYTTEDAQQRERDILQVEARGRGTVTPILREVAAAQALASTSLNAGQREAALLVTTTDSRVVAVQGLAGTGKTTMLQQAKILAEQNGYQVVGIAPSAAAALELQKAGIESQTIAAFNQRENTALNSKTLLVMDEAGMVASRDMLSVLQRVEAAGARAVLVGDVQQLKAVEAGKPFAQLQEAGIARVEMGDIQRQRNPELLQAVELAARGEVERSLAVLNRQVVEIDSSRDRYQAIAKDYAQRLPDERSATLILAGTHAARKAINDQVREQLGLAGKGLEVRTLEKKDLTAAQAKSSLSYQAGDIVQAQKSYVSLGLKKGDMARVIELSVGDAVRLTANDYKRGVVNGERAVVTGIDVERQSIALSKTDGSTIILDSTKPQHLDHGYASTVHAAQGQTADRVLIEADTRSATANESSYYVAISRASEGVTLYTDDRAALPASMGREDGKSAALDVGNARNVVEMER